MRISSSTVACANACFTSKCLSSRSFIAVVARSILGRAPDAVCWCFGLKCRPGTCWNHFSTKLHLLVSFHLSSLILLALMQNLSPDNQPVGRTRYLVPPPDFFSPTILTSIALFQCGHSGEAFTCCSVVGSGERMLAIPSGFVSTACIAILFSELAFFCTATEALTPPALKIAFVH